MASDPLALFVYGTLKRGEINHGLIASQALAIDHAWTRGLLYDVGDFPAMVPGDGQVHGELIHFDDAGIRRVLPTIDRLEGYDPGSDTSSLYLRRIVEVHTVGGRCQAFTYFYNSADAALFPLERLSPIPDGVWRHPESLLPESDDAELDAYRTWVREYHRQ